jgi:hypothetical protein
MYVLSFRTDDAVATSEKPISLLEARKAYNRWHTHNKCPLISLEILPVGDAPPFTPGDVDGVNYVVLTRVKMAWSAYWADHAEAREMSKPEPYRESWERDGDNRHEGWNMGIYDSEPW